MYHGQQQVALTTLRGQHSSQFKEFFGDAVYTAPGQRTPSQTPREGIQKAREVFPRESTNSLESLRNVNRVLREQLTLVQDQTRVRQAEMIAKLEDNLQLNSIPAGGPRRSTGDVSIYQAQNKLLKKQMKNFLKDAEAQERRIASLENYSQSLEAQNMELISRTKSGSTRRQSQERQTPRSMKGEPDLSIPGLEKWDRRGSGGNKLLNEVQGRPNTREFRKIDGPGVNQRQLQETTEKLESKMNMVLESVEKLTHRVASFQSNPPFEITSPGGAALRKMNKSVDKIGTATDEVAKVASKLSKLESTIAKLASSNILNTMVANSTKQATSIFEISDALQNMEGKFDLLVKNVVHRIESVARLVSDRHQPDQGSGENVEVQIVETPEIVENLASFKAELSRLCVGMSKIDSKLEHRELMGLDLERSRGESYSSLLTSDVNDLRKDLNSLRGEITRTTVTPIKSAVESLLDRIAAISTYMVQLKLQAFERSRDMPVKVSAWNEGWNRSTTRRLPQISEIDDVDINGNNNERCTTM